MQHPSTNVINAAFQQLRSIKLIKTVVWAEWNVYLRVIGWHAVWLVDLNYIFECDWLIKLSDNKLSNNKLSDNNLASEIVENGTLLNQSQERKL